MAHGPKRERVCVLAIHKEGLERKSTWERWCEGLLLSVMDRNTKENKKKKTDKLEGAAAAFFGEVGDVPPSLVMRLLRQHL